MPEFVYELLAKIGLDDKEFNNKLNGAGSTLQGWGSKAAKIAGGAAKVIGAGIAAAGAATVTLGKQALEAYADYEQLAGGIETLYTDAEGNTKAVQTMMENASNAWKTAGMSANEYMETAIESSAALINSLGGDVDKAAELMDMSIIDMADNVNKMGTTMEGVQNAYRGFSRGNFTMLDNLALGFAGTKEGMQELLDKATELSGVEFNIDSYSDIVQAIHVVQESMGIAGTTAKEASETISGSINSMKAAWKNLLTGIADNNADIDKLMDDLVDSISTVGKNIIPRVKTIIQGVSKAVNVAAKELVPMMVQVIIDSLPDLVTAGVELIVALLNGIATALPQLIAAIPDIIDALVNALQENWPAIKEAGGKIIEALALGIIDMGWYLGTALLELLGDLDGHLADFGMNVSAKIDDLGRNALDKIKNFFSVIGDSLSDFTSDAGDFFSNLLDQASEYYSESKSGIEDFIRTRADAVSQYFQESKQKIVDFVSNLKMLIQEGLQWLYDHTIGKLVEVAEGVREKLAQVRQHFQDLVDAAYVWGQDLLQNFADGIAAMFPHLTKAVGWVTQKISNLLGHSHPKEGPLADDYKWMPDMMQLFAEGIRDNAHLVTDQIQSSFDIGNSLKSVGTMPSTGNTTNNWTINVANIDELRALVDWWESRQVRARMA